MKPKLATTAGVLRELFNGVMIEQANHVAYRAVCVTAYDALRQGGDANRGASSDAVANWAGLVSGVATIPAQIATRALRPA